MRTYTNESNLDLMARYPDNHFDLAIVDPPYGIGVNHNMGRRRGNKNSNYKKVEWDNAAPDEFYFSELFRVSKNQIVWGANHFISKMPVDSPCWLVWDKMIGFNVSFASVEMAWTSFSKTAKKFELFPNKGGGRIHPTQKPVALYRWILQNYAKKGDLLLDTHVGSASSLIAFEELGFDYVACELDPDYFKDSTERLNKWRSQVRIEVPFTPAKQNQQLSIL